MDMTIGVTNPYAIAEELVGKPIRWSSFADPVHELTSILALSEEKIFETNSPILRPGVVEDANGKLRVLSVEEATTRIRDFMKLNFKPVTLPNNTINVNPEAVANPVVLNPVILNPNLFKSISRNLKDVDRPQFLVNLLLQPQAGGSNQPWQPANTEWFDKGDFFEDLNELTDPIQGSLANCYFIAAMSSIACSRPYAIANVIRPSAPGDEESPIHRFVFYKEGTGAGETIEVSERIPVVQGSRNWRYARSRDVGETWPAVMEKAFGKWKTSNTTDFPDYGPMAYGDPVMATAQIVRGTRHYRATNNHTGDELYGFVRANSLGGRTFNPMVAWTYGYPAGSPGAVAYQQARIVGNHAYSILGWAFQNNTPYIVLRNPWGTHEAKVDVLSGTWTSSNVYVTQVALNTDGIFAMKANTFKQYFAGLGWVV